LNNFAVRKIRFAKHFKSMKKILFSFIASGVMLLSFTGCKQSDTNQQANTENETSIDPENPMLVPTPKGYYQPKGLRKLSILEMYELGTSGMFKKDFPVKDKFGNNVSWSIMENPDKPMFMQMYVDESGHPVEAVVYEITDEIRNSILKVRIFSKPKDTSVVSPDTSHVEATE